MGFGHEGSSYHRLVSGSRTRSWAGATQEMVPGDLSRTGVLPTDDEESGERTRGP